MFIVCWRMEATQVLKTKPMTRAQAEAEVKDAASQGVRAWYNHFHGEGAWEKANG